jgi:hypothetical protein
MLSNANAVAEISKIASSFLPFVPEEEEEEGELGAVGVTEEVVVFVRHISTRPETWRDFPLFVDDDRHADGKIRTPCHQTFLLDFYLD